MNLPMDQDCLPPGYVVSPTTDDDMEYVISCTRRSVLESVSGLERELSHLWIELIMGVSESSMSERRMDDETYVVRDPSGEYAGSLWLGSSVDQFTCDATGYILGIFVEPGSRGRGVGTGLLRLAEGMFRDRGLTSVSLNVGWHNSRARRFYEHNGYTVRSEVRRKQLYPQL